MGDLAAYQKTIIEVLQGRLAAVVTERDEARIQVTDLQSANGAEVTRRRAAEKQADDMRRGLEAADAGLYYAEQDFSYLRPAVRSFASAMEARLRTFDRAKGDGVTGWRSLGKDTVRSLAASAAAAGAKLLRRAKGPGAFDQAVDTAAWAMMVADTTDGLSRRGSGGLNAVRGARAAIAAFVGGSSVKAESNEVRPGVNRVVIKPETDFAGKPGRPEMHFHHSEGRWGRVPGLTEEDGAVWTFSKRDGWKRLEVIEHTASIGSAGGEVRIRARF